jgi:L-seryl-tRNA(Ser) seleniumtransferase
MPMIGRIENDRLILDLRCLDDEQEFIANIAALGGPRT